MRAAEFSYRPAADARRSRRLWLPVAIAAVVLLFVSVLGLQFWESEAPVAAGEVVPITPVSTDASASTVTSDAGVFPESTTEPAAAVVAADRVAAGVSALSAGSGAEQVTLVSRWDNTCLGPEEGRDTVGARIVASTCDDDATQLFSFAANGSIVHQDTCLHTEGGTGFEHDPIVLATCNGDWLYHDVQLDERLERVPALMHRHHAIAKPCSPIERSA